MPLGRLRYPHLINWRHPLNRGLVSWWLAVPQWMGSNTFRDLCGRHQGTLTNGPAWRGAQGRSGGWGCLGLDGTDDYVTLAALHPGTGGTLTVSCWLRSSAAADQGVVIGVYDNTAPGSSWMIWKLSGETVVRLYSKSIQILAIGNQFDGIWHHIVCVWNGLVGTIYVDGLLNISGDIPMADSVTTIAQIGADTSLVLGYLQFQGDDFRFYNRALSATEVQQLYTESRRGYPGMLNRVRPVRWFVPEAAAVAHERSIFDGLGAAEAVARLVGGNRHLTDTSGYAEAYARLATANRLLTEVLGGTDATLRTAAHLRQLLESLGLADTPALQHVSGARALIHEMAVAGADRWTLGPV